MAVTESDPDPKDDELDALRSAALASMKQKKAEKQSQFDSSISQVPVITSEASAVAVVSSSNQIPIANPYNNYAVQQMHSGIVNTAHQWHRQDYYHTHALQHDRTYGHGARSRGVVVGRGNVGRGNTLRGNNARGYIARGNITRGTTSLVNNVSNRGGNAGSGGHGHTLPGMVAHSATPDDRTRPNNLIVIQTVPEEGATNTEQRPAIFNKPPAVQAQSGNNWKSSKKPQPTARSLLIRPQDKWAAGGAVIPSTPPKKVKSKFSRYDDSDSDSEESDDNNSDSDSWKKPSAEENSDGSSDEEVAPPEVIDSEHKAVSPSREDTKSPRRLMPFEELTSPSSPALEKLLSTLSSPTKSIPSSPKPLSNSLSPKVFSPKLSSPKLSSPKLSSPKLSSPKLSSPKALSEVSTEVTSSCVQPVSLKFVSPAFSTIQTVSVENKSDVPVSHPVTSEDPASPSSESNNSSSQSSNSSQSSPDTTKDSSHSDESGSNRSRSSSTSSSSSDSSSSSSSSAHSPDVPSPPKSLSPVNNSRQSHVTSSDNTARKTVSTSACYRSRSKSPVKRAQAWSPMSKQRVTTLPHRNPPTESLGWSSDSLSVSDFSDEEPIVKPKKVSVTHPCPRPSPPKQEYYRKSCRDVNEHLSRPGKRDSILDINRDNRNTSAYVGKNSDVVPKRNMGNNPAGRNVNDNRSRSHEDRRQPMPDRNRTSTVNAGRTERERGPQGERSSTRTSDADRQESNYRKSSKQECSNLSAEDKAKLDARRRKFAPNSELNLHKKSKVILKDSKSLNIDHVNKENLGHPPNDRLKRVVAGSSTDKKTVSVNSPEVSDSEQSAVSMLSDSENDSDSTPWRERRKTERSCNDIEQARYIREKEEHKKRRDKDREERRKKERELERIHAERRERRGREGREQKEERSKEKSSRIRTTQPSREEHKETSRTPSDFFDNSDSDKVIRKETRSVVSVVHKSDIHEEKKSSHKHTSRHNRVHESHKVKKDRHKHRRKRRDGSSDRSVCPSRISDQESSPDVRPQKSHSPTISITFNENKAESSKKSVHQRLGMQLEIAGKSSKVEKKRRVVTEDDSEGGVDLRQMLKRKQDLETVEIEKTSSKRRRKDRGAKSQYDVEESGQSPVIRPLMSKVVSPVEHHKSHHKKKKHRERSPVPGDHLEVVLNQRIQSIKEKNAAILRRRREIEQDKKKYG